MRRGIFALKRSGSRYETTPEFESEKPSELPPSPVSPSQATFSTRKATASPILPLQATFGPTQLRSVLPAKDDSLRRRSKSRSASTELEIDLYLEGSCYTPSPVLSHCSAMSVDTACPSPEPEPVAEPESPILPSAPLAIPSTHLETLTIPKLENPELATSFGSIGSSFAGDRTPCSPDFFFGRSSRISSFSSGINFTSTFDFNEAGDEDDYLAVDRRGSGESVSTLDVFGLTLAGDDQAAPSPRLGSIDPLSPRAMRGRTHAIASLPPHMRSQSPATARLYKSRSPSAARSPTTVTVAKSPRRRSSLTPSLTSASPMQATSRIPVPSRTNPSHASSSNIIELSASPLAMSFATSSASPFTADEAHSSTSAIPPLVAIPAPTRASTEPNSLKTGLPSALRGSRIKARSLAPLDLKPVSRPEPTSTTTRRPSVRFA